MTTGAFSRNVGNLFSELKLVTDTLLFIYTKADWENTENSLFSLQAADGGVCEEVVSTGNPVSYLCVDNTTGFVIAAVQHVIKWVWL